MFLEINVFNNWKAKKMHCTEVRVQSNCKGNFHFATMSEWKSTSGVRGPTEEQVWGPVSLGLGRAARSLGVVVWPRPFTMLPLLMQLGHQLHSWGSDQHNFRGRWSRSVHGELQHLHSVPAVLGEAEFMENFHPAPPAFLSCHRFPRKIIFFP